MALKLPDSAVPMGDFPVARAVDIDFDDGENLQEKLDNGTLGGDNADLTEINTKLAQLENTAVKKTIVHNIHQLTEWYAKITIGIKTEFSKILVSDTYGGCLLITGSLGNGLPSIKVVRLSNGSWDSYNPSDKTVNKIINVYSDDNFIYVHSGGYNALSIDGEVNVEKVTELPTGVTQLPILDLTQGSTADLTDVNTKLAKLENSITYSTGHTEVGKWHNGKTLYRRTYSDRTERPNNNGQLLYEFNSSIDSSQYEVVMIEGALRLVADSNTGDYLLISFPYVDPITNAELRLAYKSKDGKIQLYGTGLGATLCGFDITVYYIAK